MNDERAIRSLIEARASAMRDKDGRAAIAMLAPDLVAFELVGPLQAPPGQATDAAAMQGWFDSWEGPLDAEVRDLQLHVCGDVAFCHSFNRLRGRRAGGRTTDFWMRSTFGLRKRNGEWSIVHAHTSVPFAADGSMRASLDLVP